MTSEQPQTEPMDEIQRSIAATKVEYRQLGKCGLRVSVPILGGMSYGSKHWQDWILEEEEALPILKAAYDAGVNTIDTANMYSHGASERVIGAFLKRYSIPRHKVVIMTKVYRILGESYSSPVNKYPIPTVNATKDYVNKGGLSRRAILASVDESLERLGVDYIDVLQIHRFDATVPAEETMKALHDVVASGKVHYIGASSMWAWQFATLQHCADRHGWTRFVSMQNHYSLLYREEEREMNAYCDATGVGRIPWSPLCRGRLSRPTDQDQDTARGGFESGRRMFDPFRAMGQSADGLEIRKRVGELAEKKGASMSQVALAWIYRRCTSPIVGINSIARLNEALEVRNVSISDDEMRWLEEPYLPKAVHGHQ